MDPVPVELAWASVGEIGMPDTIRAALELDANRLTFAIRPFEQAQVHSRGML
jgi:hypothetical protein